MREVTSLPYAVRAGEQVRIKMSDGVRLMARIWRPTYSDDEPVPAVLEFIPYRHRDFTAQRDSIQHPYLAGHGYAAVRVDLRGSGDSEGVLTDEYLEQELTDAEEVLAWLAACSRTISRGPRRCSPTPPARRIPLWSASAGDRCGTSVSPAAGCGWRSGCATSGGTVT